MRGHSNARRAAGVLAALAGLAGGTACAQEGRLVVKAPLEDGRVVVVAEGDLEPRSGGSYTLRLYERGATPDEPGRFVVAMTRPREGTVDRLTWHDLDRDGRAELVVIVVREGNTAEVSAEAFSFGRNRIARRAGVARLDAGADPIAALARRVRRATAP